MSPSNGPQVPSLKLKFAGRLSRRRCEGEKEALLQLFNMRRAQCIHGRIWNGNNTFLATYEKRGICPYFLRKSFRGKYASVGEWQMGRDGEGRDRTERDGIGRKGTGRNGEGRDREERNGTGWRGTGQETERGGEGRDRTDRDWTGWRGMRRHEDGTGWRGTGQDGEGLDGVERDWTGGKGTERHSEGRDRTERKLEGAGRDQMERRGPVKMEGARWNGQGLDRTEKNQMERRGRDQMDRLFPCRPVSFRPVPSLSVTSHPPLANAGVFNYLPRSDFLGKYRQIPRFS